MNAPARIARRWGVVALLGVVSLASWQAADRTDAADARTEPVVYSQQLTTPLLSARRVPRTLQAPVADAALEPSLADAIAKSPPDTCLVVEDGSRMLSPSAKVATPVTPASNQKLLTTFVALELLGSEFRFRTTVRADTAPAAGVVTGNLYLVGAGDPFLSTDTWWTQYDDPEGRFHTRLEDLADAVVQAGIVQVTGTVVGDELLYDDQRTVSSWADRLISSNQSGPLSALSVNEGFTDWPQRTPESGGRVRSAAPAADAATVFRDLLAARGVSVAGPPAAGATPQPAVEVAAVESPPLADIVTHINSFSSNLGAELLLKRLGLYGAGQGTTEAGAGVVLSQLAARGIPTDGVLVADGSGLSETDKVTCETLAAVLTRAGPDSTLASSLSVAGVRGSLAERFDPDDIAYQLVQAKTGTLNDVLALSGFVESSTDPDEHLTFAFVANGSQIVNDPAARSVQDALVTALTGYPQAPSTDVLGPRPPTPS
ncbi:MAG: D-alanyl-D-alanine carboxypeptidase/D-alanyl-D-alanine-endopeptidase [Acidimicrobiales bacterium]